MFALKCVLSETILKLMTLLQDVILYKSQEPATSVWQSLAGQGPSWQGLRRSDARMCLKRWPLGICFLVHFIV